MYRWYLPEAEGGYPQSFKAMVVAHYRVSNAVQSHIHEAYRPKSKGGGSKR